MTKHSPGPYRPMRSGDGKQTAFFAAKDNRICEPVFVVDHDDITEKGAKVVDANMKLLAAAPELLEACIAAEKAYRRAAGEYPDDEIKALQLMRTAIAKATES